MNSLESAVAKIIATQQETQKPLAIILAGHNGSGKSTMWRKKLADKLQIPLINADRMMMSILPEPNDEGAIPAWARALRDDNRSWMQVAQQGVQAFVAHAMQANVPFALETVFSHWRVKDDGTTESKVDLIKDMQSAGYFVLLFFVGLSNSGLSILRVQTRVMLHGHNVETNKLIDRFPRTQLAINEALNVADASILVDNSRNEELAFSVCAVRTRTETLFDLRTSGAKVPRAISEWLDKVSPESI